MPLSIVGLVDKMVVFTWQFVLGIPVKSTIIFQHY